MPWIPGTCGWFLTPDGKVMHSHPVNDNTRDVKWHLAHTTHPDDSHTKYDAWNPEWPHARWGKDNKDLPNAMKTSFIKAAAAAHNEQAPPPQYQAPKPPPNGEMTLPDDLEERLTALETLTVATAKTVNDLDGAPKNAPQSSDLEKKLASIVQDFSELKTLYEDLKNDRPKRIEVFNHETQSLIQLDGPKHQCFDDLLDTVQSMAPKRRNFWLAGPAGSGKSFIVEQIGRVLGFEPDRIDGYPAIMDIIAMVGYTNANHEYFPTLFYDFYKNGGVLFLDECDASDGEVMVALNQALANGRYTFPQGKNGGGLTFRHPNFYCFATANTLGAGADMHYNRVKQDAAFMDRFTVYAMDYDPILERNMIAPQCWEFVEVVQKVRQAARDASGRDGKAGMVITPRASEKGQDLILNSKLSRRKIVNIVFGLYIKHEKWPHVGRAAEEWVARDPKN